MFATPEIGKIGSNTLFDSGVWPKAKFDEVHNSVAVCFSVENATLKNPLESDKKQV